MGKLLGLFLLGGLTANVITAQYKPKIAELTQDREMPKISIGELKWERAIAGPRISAYEIENLGIPNSDVFRRLPEPIPPGGLPIYYQYKAFFKNDGRKKIVGMSWEYIFYDLDSNAELDRHKLFSFQTIGKGKSTFVKDTSFSPPSKVVTFKSLETNRRSPYNERVEIRCVLYSDKTFWARDDVLPMECNVLNFYRLRRQRRRRLF